MLMGWGDRPDRMPIKAVPRRACGCSVDKLWMANRHVLDLFEEPSLIPLV
jgi:hypothetical protein